jgi:hypothetical protein
MCWAPCLAELSGCWLCGMLFVLVVDGRLCLVGWDDFDLWWRRSCMVSSMTKGICGSLVYTLNTDGGVGTKGGMMKMTMMVVSSVMCG